MNVKSIAAMTILLLISGSVAYGRGYEHRHYRPYPPARHHVHHHDGLGLALGIAGGLLVGSILIDAFSPPPAPPVTYSYPPSPYPYPGASGPPRVCFEDRVVEGEWQRDRGRQIWVAFPYPVTRRMQVPCY